MSGFCFCCCCWDFTFCHSTTSQATIIEQSFQWVLGFLEYFLNSFITEKKTACLFFFFFIYVEILHSTALSYAKLWSDGHLGEFQADEGFFCPENKKYHSMLLFSIFRQVEILHSTAPSYDRMTIFSDIQADEGIFFSPIRHTMVQHLHAPTSWDYTKQQNKL